MSRAIRAQNYYKKSLEDLIIGLIQKLSTLFNEFAREEY
jgi:hypothetical protein